MKKLLLLSVVVTLFANFTMAADKPVKKAAAPKPPRTPESAVTPEVKNPERHAKFLEITKTGDVGLLFLGDSITDGWPKKAPESWAKFAPYKVADFGIGGDRTEHVLWRITHGELDGLKPKVTVLMIGTNNIGHFGDEKPEWAANGVKKIIEVIHEKMPGTKVLLLGVFPRGAKPTDALRQKVEAINQIICKFDNGSNVKYLDISKKFLDDQGNLPKDIMPDSLHPNVKGYDIWYDSMWPTLAAMLK